eukprot:scaffold251207_cov35-Tisochrysis_lutea.AAC.3
MVSHRRGGALVASSRPPRVKSRSGPSRYSARRWCGALSNFCRAFLNRDSCAPGLNLVARLHCLLQHVRFQLLRVFSYARLICDSTPNRCGPSVIVRSAPLGEHPRGYLHQLARQRTNCQLHHNTMRLNKKKCKLEAIVSMMTIAPIYYR